MIAQLNPLPTRRAVTVPVRRSLRSVLDPLDRLADRSAHLLRRPGARFESAGQACALPRYEYVGPPDGSGDWTRVGLFAAIHGDEVEGAHAIVRLVELLEVERALAAGFALQLFPICNPTGFEDDTRHSRRGRDLNREFWSDSDEPEVLLLQRELLAGRFEGLIALHTDDTSDGMYGFVRGATLTKHLLEPALAAADAVLARNRRERIDGFRARDGIIRESYPGVLTAPPGVRPRPFEIILEVPQCAPSFAKEQALVVAIQQILIEYRRLMAYAPNL